MNAFSRKTCQSYPMSMTCVTFSHDGSYPTAHFAALTFLATILRSWFAWTFPATAIGRSKNQKRWSFPLCDFDHHAGQYLDCGFFCTDSMRSSVRIPS